MTANSILPGISRYPELEKQMNQRLGRINAGTSKCSSCALSSVTREFRRRLQSLDERARLSKGR